MKRDRSIATVTVAYNSARLLPAQIDALMRQTRRLDEIVVVDNASTDGTRDMLAARFPHVTVLTLPANVGVGGAYSAGLAYATIGKKHDWVWLFDDDSVPKDDGLETLLQALVLPEVSDEKIAILAPVPVHEETQLCYSGLIWRNGWVSPGNVSSRPLWFVDAVISSGTLVCRDAVKRVGLPRADFFMDFVDFEYCLRFRRQGYKIAVVRSSQLDHTIGEPRTVKFLGYTKSWPDQPPWREYYASRNCTFTIWDYYPDWRSKLYVLRRLVRHATGILAFGTNKYECVKMMLIGFSDGRAGRLGIRFIGNIRQDCLTSAANPLTTTESAGR